MSQLHLLPMVLCILLPGLFRFMIVPVIRRALAVGRRPPLTHSKNLLHQRMRCVRRLSRDQCFYGLEAHDSSNSESPAKRGSESSDMSVLRLDRCLAQKFQLHYCHQFLACSIVLVSTSALSLTI